MQRLPPFVFWQSARLPSGQQAWLSQASVSLLSTTPSQSSSTPLHTSDDGPTEPLHTFPPLLQTVVPALHCPTQFASNLPGHRSAHAPPTSVGLLSTVPS